MLLTVLAESPLDSTNSSVLQLGRRPITRYDERGPLLQRIADDIYRHYGVTQSSAG